MDNYVSIPVTSQVRLKTAALITGIGLLLMAIIAGIVNFTIIQNSIVTGNAVETADRIARSSGLFRIGALGFLAVAVLDVVVAWGLYIVFRSSNPDLSLFGAWLRLVYAVVLAIAIGSLFAAARSAAIDASSTLRYMENFNDIWNIGLVLFGLHLIVVGVLAWRASFIHWIFGVLLVIAGLGYLIDSVGVLVFPGYNLGLAMYTFVGEVVLIFWLLIRGSRLTLDRD